VLASGAAADSFPLEGKVVWRARRGIELPQSAESIPPRPVVFCGIARPQNFVLQLRAANIEPAAEAFYRDHHAYTEKDVQELIGLRKKGEAGGFITTEKDAINLGAYLSALEPLCVVPVRMELVGAANALDTMLRVIGERKRRA
jgi:tetraacyldisaccharide 4'-kinase